MRVFRFEGKGQLHGLTPDATGANLPERAGPWEFEREFDLEADDGSFAEIDIAKALEDIDFMGYHVGGSETLYENRGYEES